MSLDDIQKRYDERPKGTGGWQTYPTLRLDNGDQAFVRFLGTGLQGDELISSASFHRVQRISKRTNQPYAANVYCTRSVEVESNCEFCAGIHGAEAQKTRMVIGAWLWVSHIVRSQQNKEAVSDASKAYPVEELGGRKVFVERINGPVVWERGPGKDSEFISKLMLMRNLLGQLNKCDIIVARQGSGMNDTYYNMTPIQETANKPLTPEQSAIIPELPAIQDVFSGAKEWPPKPENEQMTPEQLNSLVASGASSTSPTISEEERKTIF